MNKITLVGNVGKQDAELRYLPDGTPVASFSLATTKKTGQKETTIWWKITIWRIFAEKMAPHITSGKPLIIFGEVDQIRLYQNKDGVMAFSAEVTADTIQFQHGDKNDNANGNGSHQYSNGQVADASEIPF